MSSIFMDILLFLFHVYLFLSVLLLPFKMSVSLLVSALRKVFCIFLIVLSILLRKTIHTHTLQWIPEDISLSNILLSDLCRMITVLVKIMQLQKLKFSTWNIHCKFGFFGQKDWFTFIKADDAFLVGHKAANVSFQSNSLNPC